MKVGRRLFADLPESRGPAAAPSDAPDDAPRWAILDHACKLCMGRILRSGDTLRCAECGTEAKADKRRPIPSSSLCACGLSEPIGSNKKQWFRCVPNKQRSDANRAEITLAFGDLPATGEPVA